MVGGVCDPPPCTEKYHKPQTILPLNCPLGVASFPGAIPEWMFHLEPSSIAPRSCGERSAAKPCSHTRTPRRRPRLRLNPGALQTNPCVRGSAWPADIVLC